MRFPPPVHLPVLLALSVTLLSVDASDGPPDALLTHLRPLVTPRPPPSRAPSPPPPVPNLPPKQDLVVQFTKKLYKDLGNNLGHNATALADKYQGEFDQLDSHTGGRLGETLSTLFEIRMLDLQASIRHARRMRQVIDEFTGKLILPSSI